MEKFLIAMLAALFLCVFIGLFAGAIALFIYGHWVWAIVMLFVDMGLIAYGSQV